MRPLRPLVLPLLLFTVLAPDSARAAVHLNQITQIMVGYNGDTRIQAVQLRSIFANENLVAGASINAYDGAGNLLATGGTFGGNVANGANGAFILCATRNFEQAFGITADLRLTDVLPVTNGQVSFEAPGCFVNAIAYGHVTAILNGPTSAPPLPADGAAALVRVVSNSTSPFCPLAEEAYGRFTLVTAGPNNPLVFTNNANQSVSVFSTATAVEPSPLPAVTRVTAAPNPASGRVRFSASSPGPGRLRVFSAQGRLVWEAAIAGAGRREIGWDGADRNGGRAPSGLYLLQLESGGARETARFLFLR